MSNLDGRLLLGKHCLKSYKELKDFLKKKDIPVIELIIARVLERAIAKAEINYLNWIYERLGWEHDEKNLESNRTVTLNYKLD